VALRRLHLPRHIAPASSDCGGFSEALRAELADKPGIHICDIYPAFVDTPGLKHGANYIGREISAPPPLLDPRTVAETIIAVIRRPRATTTVGLVTNATRLAHLLASDLAARTLGRFIASYFKRARPVATSDGNLYQPSPDSAHIDGGLRSSSGISGPLLLGAAMTAIALGAIVASKASRSRTYRALPRSRW
jgi:hypothetical protein